MKTKPIIYFILGLVALSIIIFWFQVYILGRYYENAGFLFTVLFGLVPVYVIFALIYLIKSIHKNNF